MQLEAGWELPVTYGDESGERSAIRDTIALADITARGKIDVRGTIDPVLDAAGDELTARISPGWALVLTAPGGEEVLLPKLEAAAGSLITDATHLYAGYALCGPSVSEVIARTSGWDPSTLDAGSATGAPIADVRAVVVRRGPEMDVLEIYVGAEFARYVWETLYQVAGTIGGRPVGWRALRAEGWS